MFGKCAIRNATEIHSLRQQFWTSSNWISFFHKHLLSATSKLMIFMRARFCFPTIFCVCEKTFLFVAAWWWKKNDWRKNQTIQITILRVSSRRAWQSVLSYFYAVSSDVEGEKLDIKFCVSVEIIRFDILTLSPAHLGWPSHILKWLYKRNMMMSL